MLRGDLQSRVPIITSQPAMTIYKTVVSWLAFWFLTLKGLFLVMSANDYNALPWLPLWALPGLLIMVPWAWRYPWKIRWIEENMPFDEAQAERCNLAGRWLLWGFLVAYHMGWLPDPLRIYLYHEAPVWEGFFFFGDDSRLGCAFDFIAAAGSFQIRYFLLHWLY